MKNFTGCCLKGITLLTYMSPIDGKLHLKTKEQVIISWEGIGFLKTYCTFIINQCSHWWGKEQVARPHRTTAASETNEQREHLPH